MKRILFTTYDMEVGGAERSLTGLLHHFDYSRYKVDLMLYRHQGDFLDQIPHQVHLLQEQGPYATFRKSISEVLREKRFGIGLSRIVSKIQADLAARRKRLAEPGYYQMQLMWKYALPFLPRLEQAYDIAVSYLWPHDFVASKVTARRKIAWIHTDYSTVTTDVELDLRMWNQFDCIVAVSEACRQSFLRKYASLQHKVMVMENICSPPFIRSLAAERCANPMEGDERFKLLTVARLSHAKGIDNAVRALRLLFDRGCRDIVWYVVGYGGEEATIRKLIAECGLEEHFVLLGKQKNPYPFMAACDLYVQPSRYEGKAVTVTEAQILGKPVLITNYSTAFSQVNDGVDGHITELSVEGIAAGIERLYRDGEFRERLAGRCRATDYGNSGELDKLYRWIEGERGVTA